MDFFGMKEITDKPTKNKFVNKTTEEFERVFGLFVETYVYQWKLPTRADDFVMNYGLCTIFLTVLILQLKDAAAEGDGQRNLINQKMLLSVFKSLGAYSKYAIEMFISIAQIEFLLTPQLSEQFKWGFYVNWKGGVGNNIETDLAQEIMNAKSKAVIHRMGPNKTIDSITKICRAISGITDIVENADDLLLNVHKTSTKHTTRSSEEDEKGMIKDILNMHVFRYEEGRSHPSFPNIKRSPMRYMNIIQFHKWIDKQLSYLK